MPTRLVSNLLLPGVMLAALAAAAPAHAADPDPTDQWLRWLGTPQEATVRSLDFIGPLLFAGTEGDGVFSSPTAIGPWSQNDGGLDSPGSKSVRQVKVAPDGEVYAATTDGLFRSFGGAGGWTQVGGGTGSTKLNMGGIQSVMFNGPSGLDMTVAVAGAGGPGIYNSSDHGQTWSKADGLPDGENVYALSSGPLTVPMYAAADDGVFASVDFGRHWKLISDGIPPGETTLRVAVSPTDPTDLYASTSSSVYVSHTAGVTWEDASGVPGSQLPAGGKRAFLLLPSLSGKFGEHRALVGTEQGVWATNDDGKHWGQMSPSSFAPSSDVPMKDRVVWSLGLGFSTPVLMAGTAGFGVFNLPIKPITPGAPTITPNPPGAAKNAVGAELSITNLDLPKGKGMGFGGTRPYFFTYQWLKCFSAQTSTCATTIQGATGPTYTIPTADAGKANAYYAVKVTGSNVVSPLPVSTISTVNTAGVADVPGSEPKRSSTPNITQSPAGSQAYLGTTFTIPNGTWRTEGSASLITPSAFKYRWDRCDAICTPIPGATGPSYTTTPADIGQHIAAYIGATGPAPGFAPSDMFLVTQTLSILNRFPVNTTLPKIVGNAYTGVTLSSSAGGWSGYAMTFARRWFRCESDGLGCNPIAFPSQTGSSYTVTQADLGKRLQLELTATAADPNQNRVTTVFSATTAVITDPPPPVLDPPADGGGADGNGSGGGSGQNGGGQPGGQQVIPGGPTQKPFSVPVALPKKIKVGATLALPKTVAGYGKVSYQWLRNGKKITRATKRTYKLARADRGKRISCHVILTPTGGGTKVVVDTAPVTMPKK